MRDQTKDNFTRYIPSYIVTPTGHWYVIWLTPTERMNWEPQNKGECLFTNKRAAMKHVHEMFG